MRIFRYGSQALRQKNDNYGNDSHRFSGDERRSRGHSSDERNENLFDSAAAGDKTRFRGYRRYGGKRRTQGKTAAFDDEECMCGHEEHAESKWRKYLLHPLGHAAVVFAYILAVNLVFGTIVHFVGKDSFVAFISGSKAFQPLLTCLIGLIPNCASSVIITQAYILGGISFGSCLAGLCVNAGLGYAVLLKDKSNLKRNLLLIGTTFVLSVALGYATNLVVGLIA